MSADAAPSPPRIAGVLLAAGAGRRMGGPKALVRWDGRPLVELVVELLTAGGCDPVLVVLGAEAERIEHETSLAGAQIVLATDWAEGMGSSLRAGLQACSAIPAVDAVVVALVDQPGVTAGAVDRLVAAYASGATAAVATYSGRQRNPVLLARRHWSDIAALAEGELGARAWLRANPALVTTVDCTDTGVPGDLDTPADLVRPLRQT